MAEEEPRGFLGRWARRKTDVLQGKPLDEPAPPAKAAVLPAPVAVPATAALAPDGPTAGPAADPATPVAKPLSLDDVSLLTKDSDFKPFMATNVGPDVRNAAMKKLFADPHFNVMDGLDIYIDDYSKSDPIPESMLRQMTSAKFLNLFDDEEEKADAGNQASDAAPQPAPAAGENAYPAAGESVAQSTDSPAALPTGSSALSGPSDAIGLPGLPVTTPPALPTGAQASPHHHAHTDLRLQPDHAAPAPGAGHGTE